MNNEDMKTKIKNVIPVTIAPKKMKYLGIHFTNYVQDLYPENYKTLMK